MHGASLVALLAPTLGYVAPSSGLVLRLLRTHRSLCALQMADGSDYDMRVNPCSVLLFDFDAMVPGQRFTLPCPGSFAEICRTVSQNAATLCMVGRHRLTLHSHGVEVTVESISEEGSDGDATVILKARRFCQILDAGTDQGSRWLGRDATVRWVGLEAEEEPTAEELELSASLGPLVEQWIDLVRSTERERVPGQLEGVLSDLGPMPPTARPNARALWVAGLVNPLPALGVALEIRPHALMAETAQARLTAAAFGLKDSIRRMGSSGPLF